MQGKKAVQTGKPRSAAKSKKQNNKTENKITPPSVRAAVAKTVVVPRPPPTKQKTIRPSVIWPSQGTQGSHTMSKSQLEEMSNRKRKAVHKHMASQGVMLKYHENMYLKTLLDPENYTGVRYPDSFARKTAAVPGLINHDMFVFPSTSEVESPGLFLNIVTPSLTQPVLEYYEATPTSTLFSAGYRSYISAQTTDFGIFPAAESEVGLPASTKMLQLPYGTWNVRAPWNFFDGTDSTTDCPPFKGLNEATIFYGHPVVTGSTAAAANPNIRLNLMMSTESAVTGDSDITVRLISEYGTHDEILQAVTGSSLLTATISGTDLIASGVLTAAVTAGYYGAGLPGMGYQLINSSLVLGVLAFEAYVFGYNNVVPAPQFRVIPLPDVSTYIDTVTQYRPVSCSSWVEYEGADLTNGGQCAALLYRGGRPFSLAKLWDYNVVAETPGSYQTRLKLGSYSIWLPATERDVLMREIGSEDRWDSPYIVNVGLVASPDLEHVLRLRVPINFELVSTAQFFNYSIAPIHPEWISQAVLITSAIQTSMENPTHQKFIGDILNTGIDILAGIGKGIVGSVF
jgi:hypothetical protein